MKKINVFQTDNTFVQLTSNPFHNNQPYTEDWALIRLIEKAEGFSSRTRPCVSGEVFQFEITKELPDWKYRIGDFLQYGIANRKNLIAAIDEEDLSAAKKAYDGHQYNERLRDYEPKVLVHTTIKENYEKIVRDAELKCWRLCKTENMGWEDKPIGALSNDPTEYSDYIMFGTDGFWDELIPLAKQRGYIDMDVDSLYTAGARFYFDSEAIANDGLLVRDGIHRKVKNKLPLQPYLLWVATPGALGLPEQTTPRIFGETADRVFADRSCANENK